MAIQEQNAYPGLTTRWLAKKANQVHLGFPEAEQFLKPNIGAKVHLFGNPIIPPPSPRPDRNAARDALGVPHGKAVVLVVGGSQGARAINQTVAELVNSLALEDIVLLWGTGQHTWSSYSHLNEPSKRVLRAFWDPIADAYAAADIVIARAGAMTTAELCAWGLPSILIPLPSAAANHQQQNAEALAEAGAAVHLPESELSPRRLRATLDDLLDDQPGLARIEAAAAARGRPDAALNIANEVLRLVS
jgi:UDP-N-acetylglucosamine--N-acetylmuramyl-(pentapeptide) pyrophosphoryl-undecaprenol N-acetylglucosamine transferase